LLPHKGDAVLLDRIHSVAADRLTAGLVVKPGTAFSDASGSLPGWIGPEIMAQAIAALAGYRRVAAHRPPGTIGLLLGLRSYETSVAGFRQGEVLVVEVVESSEDEEGRAVFDGKILRREEVLASGTLTVFQPQDDSFLDREYSCHE